MQFIDEATIRVSGGKGGNGCLSFRRIRELISGTNPLLKLKVDWLDLDKTKLVRPERITLFVFRLVQL